MKKNWIKWIAIFAVLGLTVFFVATGQSDKAMKYFESVIEMIDKQQDNDAKFGEGTFGGDTSSLLQVFPVMTGKA